MGKYGAKTLLSMTHQIQKRSERAAFRNTGAGKS